MGRLKLTMAKVPEIELGLSLTHDIFDNCALVCNAMTGETMKLDGGGWSLQWADGSAWLQNGDTNEKMWVRSKLNIEAGRSPSGNIFLKDKRTNVSSWKHKMLQGVATKYCSLVVDDAAANRVVKLKALELPVPVDLQKYFWQPRDYVVLGCKFKQ